MLNIRDLRIDPASLGEKMLLVEIIPSYEYKDGTKTNNISGYRYVVALPKGSRKRLDIKYNGVRLKLRNQYLNKNYERRTRYVEHQRS